MPYLAVVSIIIVCCSNEDLVLDINRLQAFTF